MIVARFKVRCRPDRTDEVAAAMARVAAPSRQLRGVVAFDVARDLIDADVLLAVEVFDDHDALERQEAQPEVAAVMALIEGGALAADPEWNVYQVAPADTNAG